MLKNERITFIGGGTMGEAIIKVLVSKELIPPEQVTASEPRVDRCEELAQRYGINVTTDNVAAVGAATIVVLSVKPQVLPVVLGEIHGKIPPDAMVLSIVAGVSTDTLTTGLDHAAAVRAMPNTPAQIGEGMTVWIATAEATAAQRGQVQAILQAMGHEIQVYEEKELDMATAVSGTGPAYVFLVMEAMTDAAVHLGFSRYVARELVLQTMLGSVLFASQSDAHLAHLRNMVTSPGGTTADALYQMEKGSLRTVISKAIWAAYQKSCLLGQMQPALNGPVERGLNS
jgi:pyrroline-5-carboxylate reductase